MTGIDLTRYGIKMLDLVPGMRRVASTNGGEYAGPCPFCGGKDRFRVQPIDNRWFCRQCGDGKWHDAIDFIMRRDGCTFSEATKKLNIPMQVKFVAEAKKTDKQQKPPDQEWQAMAYEVIERCKTLLFTKAGDPGLDYLLSRGISSPTMERYHLGYSPCMWVGKVKIPQGIIIPAIVGGMCWYIKIRSLPNSEGPRYLCVPGSKTNAVFGAEEINGKPYALISEGEFNAMTLNQEIGQLISTCSLGSAVNKLDMLTWGRFFLSQKVVMCLFDNDPAGEKGFENMSEMLGDRARRLPLPGNGDMNDFHVAGGDIETWFKPFWKEFNGSKE